MFTLTVPVDLTPSGVISFVVEAFITGMIFGLVIVLVVEARRMLRLGGK